MADLTDGDKVKYHTGDEKWKNGVIHGVRKVDDVSGQPRVLSFLIDTGRDFHTDVFEHSLKDEAFAKEFVKHVKRGVNKNEAHAKAAEATGSLPDERVTEVVRQPEQVDVRPEWVKPR